MSPGPADAVHALGLVVPVWAATDAAYMAAAGRVWEAALDKGASTLELLTHGPCSPLSITCVLMQLLLSAADNKTQSAHTSMLR